MADLSNPINFLSKALEETLVLENEKAKLAELTDKKNLAEKNLTILKKDISREKEKTVKSRREDIEDSFDKQIKSIESDIRTVNEKRSKARNSGVKSRIDEHTKTYKDDIKNIRGLIKEKFKKAGLSQIYNNKFFFSLYMPHSVGEWTTAIITFLIVFCLVPIIIINMQFTEKTPSFYSILVYTLDILVFGSIYVFIGNKVRIKHNDTLKSCRELMDQINKDKKSIKKVTRQIRRDKDDSLYDLGAFDDELTQHRQKCETVNIQKDEALNKFDAVTKQVLMDEIDSRYIDELANRTAQLEQLKLDFKSLSDSVEEKTLYVNDQYGQYIGVSNISSEKIRQMIEMIRNKEAGSISEAASRV
ncbi:MAG: hypothetical protein Q4B86_00820 [Eubacteriales bacterium]|nr:hypothetical protein [Eubacteriales bacterium]